MKQSSAKENNRMIGFKFLDWFPILRLSQIKFLIILAELRQIMKRVYGVYIRVIASVGNTASFEKMS